MTNQSDSLRLHTIEAFLAAAAYENYTKAGTALGIDATTVGRRIKELDEWLHRVLLTTDVPYSITEFGDDFVLVAAKVVELIDEGGLKAEIGKTRVQADGTMTIEGQEYNTAATKEIGATLVASRATIDPNYRPPPLVSGKDIDLSFLKCRTSD